jgi:hypothetical protein
MASPDDGDTLAADVERGAVPDGRAAPAHVAALVALRRTAPHDERAVGQLPG